MDHDAVTTACSKCGSFIAPEEFEQGLAVRIAGEPVCTACTDALPTQVKLRIERLRAQRGLDATVYRYRHPAHPELESFTFTSTHQLMRHRRARNRGEDFTAPMIGPRSAATTASAPTAGSAPTARRWGVGAGIAAAAVIAGIALTFTLGDDEHAVTPAVRADFPADPQRAWSLAATRLDTGDPLRRSIAEELARSQEQALDAVRSALATEDPVAARAALAKVVYPDHADFARQHKRTALLADRIADLERRRARLAERRTRDTDSRDGAPEPPPRGPTGPATAPPPETGQPEPALAATDADPVAAETADVGIAAEPESEPETEPETEADAQAATAAPDPPPPGAQSPSPVAPVKIELADLVADDDQAWSRDDRGARLEATLGSLSRQLALPPGAYVPWVQLRDTNDSGYLLVSVAGTTFELPGTVQTGQRARWHRIPGAAVEVGDQAVQLDVVGSKPGWNVFRIVLADPGTDHAPKGIDAIASATWADAPGEDGPAAADAQAEVTVTVFEPDLEGRWQERNYYDPRDLVPASLPGNCSPQLYASEDRLNTGHTLHLDLSGRELADGGLVLLLHPMRLVRNSLRATLVDTAGRRHKLPDVIFTAETPAWSPYVIDLSTIPLPEDPRSGFDPRQLARLTLTDAVDDISTAFLLGKTVAITGRAPQQEDLDLRFRALRAPEAEHLAKLLQHVWQRRATGVPWQQGLDPTKVKLLVGEQLFKGSFQRDLYDGLEELNDERPQDRSVAPLQMVDAWLDKTFIIPPELIDKAHHHMIVVATGGKEFAIGLDVRRARENFWRKMIIEAINSGVLPVVALGPNKTHEQSVPQARELWTDVLAMVEEDFPGVPVIDLRVVPVSGFERFPPGSSDLCTGLLLESYAELKTRIEILGEL
ncbi:MAG: hypothetical protein ACOCZK_02030 [Planctomycetota bacterium]